MKIVTILFTVILSGCLQDEPVKTGQEGNVLPSFNLLLRDSTTKFNTNNIPQGKPIVLFYFTPSCHFCKAQTEEFISDMKSFTNVRFYFFTTFPLQQINKYYEHYQLKNFSNITVGQDCDSYFEKYFDIPRVPYIAVYSKDKRLKQVFMGKTNTEIIKNLTFKQLDIAQ